MKRQTARKSNPAQLILPAFKPLIIIPAIVLPDGAGGFTVRAGRPIIEGETVSVARAARMLSLSERRIQTMIIEGLLEADQPGGPRGKYRVKLASVQSRIGTLWEQN